MKPTERYAVLGVLAVALVVVITSRRPGPAWAMAAVASIAVVYGIVVTVRRRRIRAIDRQARWLVYSLPAGPAFAGWEIGIERTLYDRAERHELRSWAVEPGEVEKLDVLADATLEAQGRNRALDAGRESRRQ